MEAFASDKECCYYTKLLTLILGIGMDVLHNYFERKILDTKDFCTFLNIHKHCLFHERYPKIQCCECSKKCLVSSKRGSLNETQFQQLFDITPPTEKDHFQTGRNNVITKDCLCRIKANESNEVDCMDITLLCAIINSCFINSNQSIHGYPIDFETIKATRNFLSHRPGNRISEAEFNTRWVNMEQAILGIASTVGNYFAKANKRKICALKEKALSIEGLVEIIKNNADVIKKNLLDPLEIQRNNTALVTDVKDEITQLLQKYKDEMSVDIGNLRFEVKQFTKAMSNSCPEVKVDTQGQVPHMDTAVCVSDEQMTEEGQDSLIDTAVCVSDVQVTGQDKRKMSMSGEEENYMRKKTNPGTTPKGNMLSGEEENYMRLFMLLDICKKAVKIYFDEEFDPNHLNQTIKKAGRKLLQLKKTNVLSETQWIILQGNKLDSSDFDIPLMICLLRNLADLPISDLMPLESQRKPTDELTRIKFYRNAIVNGNRSNLSDERFLTNWNTICKSIQGLSDELFEECESLHVTGLDLLNKDIKICIQNAFKELSEFNTLHEKLKKEWEIQKERKTNPIPPNLRVKIDKKLKSWKEETDNFFVSTKGSKAVIESIKEEPCVAVTGSFGIGKTAVIRNVALLMRSNGYIVVPVTDPSEIKKYKHPLEKNLFVVDNFCGICDLVEEELEAWNNCGVEFDEKCKLLVSCKLQVYRAIRHESLNNITFHECNLISNDICLSLDERQSIARKYDINILEIIDYIEYFNCFPLLCNNFTIEKIDNAQDFFKHPFEVFETQFEMLQALGANGKVCALMILLMFPKL
ncbi:uncharacterized protein [Mytilus edulis]|uniref:uncharacterized protein isoform X2 n=1 Tax=Mytilus edulis TaxID=6550 RepID=UPI0039EEBDA5